MKIGIEVQRLFRPKKHGMEVVALELIRQLQKTDTINQYTIFAKEDEDVSCLSETKNFIIEKVPAYSYADWEQIQLPKAIKKANVDFLHSTCNTSALRQSTPLLLTLHDVIYMDKLDFRGTAYQNFGNLYRRFVVPRVVKKSDTIITVSSFAKDTILDRLDLPEEKVEIVYNAVSDIFHNGYSEEEVEAFKKEYKLPEKYIFFQGNTAPRKNTQNVLLAYVEYCLSVRDALPIVITNYDRSLVEEALTAMGQKKLMPNLVFPGYLAAHQMPLIYCGAYLFLYPSLQEGFGLPILEAMACGTPVVTSTTTSMPEVAGGAALLADPYNAQDIAAGINNLVSDAKLYNNFVEKGLKRAAEFTWESSTKSLLSIYERFQK